MRKKAWRGGPSSQRKRKLSQRKRSAEKSLGFAAVALAVSYVSCLLIHQSLGKPMDASVARTTQSRGRSRGHTGRTGASHGNENGVGAGIHIAPLSLPQPAPQPLDLATKQISRIQVMQSHSGWLEAKNGDPPRWKVPGKRSS